MRVLFVDIFEGCLLSRTAAENFGIYDFCEDALAMILPTSELIPICYNLCMSIYTSWSLGSTPNIDGHAFLAFPKFLIGDLASGAGTAFANFRNNLLS